MAKEPPSVLYIVMSLEVQTATLPRCSEKMVVLHTSVPDWCFFIYCQVKGNRHSLTPGSAKSIMGSIFCSFVVAFWSQKCNKMHNPSKVMTLISKLRLFIYCIICHLPFTRTVLLNFHRFKYLDD